MGPRKTPTVRSIGLAAVTLGIARFLRRQTRTWGATGDEIQRVLPGDELLANVNQVATRATTIEATPAEVWPWIVQLGQGRGGFYSYDGVENLIGCNIHSADDVVPEWQHLNIGDAVQLAPEVALHVARLDTGQALVLSGGVPIGARPAPYEFTWAFVLSDSSAGCTRLVVRERYAYTQWWTALLVEPIQLVSFVMTQRMLRGIRIRATRPRAPRPIATARQRSVGSR